MKLKDIGVILLLATLWFTSAYYATAAIFPFFALECGLINLIIGLFCIAIINRSPAGSQLLYDGQKEGRARSHAQEELSEEVGCAKIVVWLVISFPFSCFCGGTMWWILRWLGFFGLD